MTVVDIDREWTIRSTTARRVTYVGVEPSPTLRQNAPIGVNLLPGSFPHIPLPDAFGDMVICFAVLHHLPSREGREQAVHELIRLTKPGGIIAATSWFLPSHRSDLLTVYGGDPGDVWVPWRAQASTAKRYVHLMQPEEWDTLWNQPELRIERLRLFGKQGWTSDRNSP